MFLWCVRESSFWSPLHSSLFSDLNNSGEQHVLCYFNVGCQFSARQRGAIQRLDVRAPLLALRSPSSSLLCPSAAHSQYGGMADSTSRSMTGTERRPARFFKEAAGAESSSDEFGILELPPARAGVRLGAPPLRARGGLVCVWRWQEHFLHDGPIVGMCTGTVRVVTRTAAWWIQASPRTHLGGAISPSGFGPLETYFLEIRKSFLFCYFHFLYFFFFRKVGPLHGWHLTK